jgi:hypothetical protein
MINWPAAKRPAEAAAVGRNRQVVNAGIAPSHQATIVELPVLVPERSEPVATVVMSLVGKSDGDPIAAKGPEFLDQPVIQLSPPFCRKKRQDCFPPGHKFSTVSPLAVYAVSQSDPGRVAAVPAGLRQA